MTARQAALLLVGVALVRGALVALVIPPFHGADEQAHFDYAERLLEARALPEPYPCQEYSPELRAALHQLVEPINFHP